MTIRIRVKIALGSLEKSVRYLFPRSGPKGALQKRYRTLISRSLISIALLGATNVNHVVAADRLAQLPTADQPQAPLGTEPLPDPSTPAVPPVPVAPQAPGDASGPVDQRDPMIPSAEILERLQPRQTELSVAQRATASLPPLPRFRLAAIVLNDDSTGTAMITLDMGNQAVPSRSISLSLNHQPLIAQARFPKRQFWQEQRVLDAIDEEIADRQSDGATEPALADNTEPWVHLDGFELDGVFFIVEEFTDKAILLRAHPHDKLLLVR